MKTKASNEHEEGLLEYLEDIIGSNRYIEPIEESSKLVGELTERCQERGLRAKVAEKECQSLAGDKDAAIKYVKYENELAMKKADLFQAMLYRSRVSISKTEKEISDAKDRLERLQAKQGSDNEDLLRLEADVKTKHVIVQNADKEAAKISARIMDIERIDVQCKSKRDELKRKLTVMQKSSKEDQKARADTERDLASINNELQTLEQTSEELKASLKAAELELEKVCESLKPVTGNLQVQLEKKQVELEPWNAKIRTQQESLEVAKMTHNMAQDKINAGAQELASVERDIVETESELKKLQLDRSGIQTQGGKLVAELKDMDQELKALESREPILKNEISVLHSTIAEASESAQEMFVGNKILTALMGESSSGRIKGIHVLAHILFNTSLGSTW